MVVANVTLDAYNILVGIILYISMLFRYSVSNNVKRWFKNMVLLNVAMAATDIFTLLYEGPESPVNFIILPVSMFLFYGFAFAVFIASGIEIMYFVDKPKFRKKYLTMIIIATSIFAIMLIITPFTGFLYSIDENNIYTRGKFFGMSILLEVILYIDLIIYISANKKELNKKDFTTIIMFILFPQIMQIIQLASYGVSLVNTGYTMAFLIMFIESNHALEDNLNLAGNKIYAKNAELERSKQQIIEMQNHTIESLSNLVESRDESTGKHVRRTIYYVESLSSQLMQDGYFTDILTPSYIRLLKRAAPMHDIGKIVISDTILKKPGKLTDEEFEQVKCHTTEGNKIIHEILDEHENPDYIKVTADIATYHHERWDGNGYPAKLKGDEIPLCARIMAIADVFDALVSPRVYKDPMPYDEVFQLMSMNSGSQFDPIILSEFLKIKDKFIDINEKFKSTI